MQGVNFAKIDELVFEISCSRAKTDGQTDRTEYIISSHSTAGGVAADYPHYRLSLFIPQFSDCGKMSLPKRSLPYWSNPLFLIFYRATLC